MRCGKLEEAGECAHQAIEVCRANSPRRTPLGIETSPSAEALMELRTLAGDYYTQGHLEKAESLLRELIAQDFEPCSNQLHIARLMLLTDRIVEAWEIVEEAALSSAEAPNYVLARLLWFQLALTLLDPARAADGKGEKTETLLGRLKTLLQEPDVVSEWWMQPVIDHLRARIETQACNLLTALFTALNSPGQLALLESFPEWRDQPAVPLDAR
jgi:hypothetical protein